MGHTSSNKDEETFELFSHHSNSMNTSLTSITLLDDQASTDKEDITLKIIESSNHSQVNASTPISNISTIVNMFRSADQDIVNDFFQTIEQLVRAFVQRPNCLFPYYRVMRWTTNDVEHFVTVIINRPTVFS